jgi:hypothetical protein
VFARDFVLVFAFSLTEDDELFLAAVLFDGLGRTEALLRSLRETRAGSRPLMYSFEAAGRGRAHPSTDNAIGPSTDRPANGPNALFLGCQVLGLESIKEVQNDIALAPSTKNLRFICSKTSGFFSKPIVNKQDH